jgi:hypothetical protein
LLTCERDELEVGLELPRVPKGAAFDEFALRELLVGRPSMQTIRQAARKGGMKTLLEAGVGKVLAGITSVSEMQRVAK